jgi:hypothetical protein
MLLFTKITFTSFTLFEDLLTHSGLNFHIPNPYNRTVSTVGSTTFEKFTSGVACRDMMIIPGFTMLQLAQIVTSQELTH